jgi:transcriptional regulator with XRE-family HTH domain
MAAMKTGFGSILSEWRAVRRLSQLDLALLTGISQRHISFVESGRAQPSRDMIFKLADGLDLHCARATISSLPPDTRRSIRSAASTWRR